MINIVKNLKICSIDYCPQNGKWQPISNFSKDIWSKFGLQSQCKMCAKIYRDGHKKEREKYLQENKETIIEQTKRYYQNNKKEINIAKKHYFSKRKKENIEFKIKCYLRTRLYNAVKSNYKSGSAIADLCCSISNFKIWIEEQFYSHPITGEVMTWNNYGKLWHIDHIIPLSSVDLIDRKQLLKVCHWFNLRPRWAYQNIGESDRGMSRNRQGVSL